ncbi:MAG: sensor histidine kinase [Elusimicrobia bacterium]|nr:sensor histidine kinase [Elusimicrobiota bacterium]
MRSLRVKVLFLFSLAVLIPIAIITFLIVSISYRSLWKSIQREQTEITRRVGEKIYSYIESTRGIIVGLASIEPSGYNTGQVRKRLSEAMKISKSITEITIVDRQQGRDVIRAERPGRYVVFRGGTVDRKKREEFIKAVSENFYISRVYFSGQRRPYIIISCAGRKVVVIAKLGLEELWKIVENIKIGDGGHAFVVDRTGYLIAHPQKERVIAHADFSGLPPVKEFMSGELRAFSVYPDEANREKLISFCYVVPEIRWGVFTNLPYGELMAPVNKMVFQTSIWTLVFSSVFLFLGIKFVGGLLDPIGRLREFAHEISRGKFNTKIDIRTGDELQELAGTFNDMATALHELEELRQDLISMIVHDMKSPLSGIIGSLDYLLSGRLEASSQNEILTITKRSADNLYGLVQNLLDVSKMEDGKLVPDKTGVGINDLLKDVTEQFKLMADAESKGFETKIADGVSSVSMDYALIKRVLNNILFNSLHHTSAGGKIWLNVGHDDGNVLFEVGDDGVGIPEEYRTKIFEKFVQVERRRARLRTGTGLGLTFCKMAVELHGGKIWVESEEDRGSRFFFTLPL